MAMMMDLMGRKLRCRHDYIRELEEERRKIEAFQRELPLCLELLTQAIEIVRQQMCDDDEEEKPTSRTPVLEEFIPLKLSSTMEEMMMMMMMETAPEAAAGSETTPDWLRSAQLWNQEPDTALKVEPPKKPIAVSLKNTGGAFQPFEKGAKKRIPPPPAAAASSASSGSGGDCSGNGGDNNKEKESKEGQSKSTQRKERRCWSPELHRRFLNALHQLGGCHVATPKQIRELMKVDGLTNDEVKSHLQKYRLHTTKRPTPAVHRNSSSPAPRFVLVGGILVPPADYAAVAVAAQATTRPGNGACDASDGIYAPVPMSSLATN